MALHYKALTEEDITRLRCLPKGDYDFYVSDILQTKSRGGLDKNGNPKKIYDMLEVRLRIVLTDNTERQVRDWVLIVNAEDAMGFKLRHFAETCGLLNKYENNQLEAYDFKGKHGKVRLGVQDYTDKQTGELMKMNSVLDYVRTYQNQPNFNPGEPFDDNLDDIPL